MKHMGATSGRAQARAYCVSPAQTARTAFRYMYMYGRIRYIIYTLVYKSMRCVLSNAECLRLLVGFPSQLWNERTRARMLALAWTITRGQSPHDPPPHRGRTLASARQRAESKREYYAIATFVFFVCMSVCVCMLYKKDVSASCIRALEYNFVTFITSVRWRRICYGYACIRIFRRYV